MAAEERNRGRGALVVAVLWAAALLWLTRSELTIAREPLNDLAFHIPLTERLAEAFESGESPLDAWVPEFTLGYPVPRTYQPLGSVAVVLAHAALGGLASVTDVFVAVHWLLIGLLPLSIYGGARRMGLSPATSAAAAVLSPLLSTNLLFGLELGSTTWRGSGLFTQSWAQHLLPWSLGFGLRRLRGDGRAWPAALLLALTFAAHFVYGLIGAITLALAALLPSREGPPAAARLMRLAVVGVLTFAFSAWLLVPLATDHDWVNRSRWEDAWKWDAFGLPKVARLLATGELLDYGRFPTLTLLALVGAAVIAARCVLRRESDAERVVALGAVAWVLLLAGRPAWDGLLDLAGLGDVPLHRLIGGTHLFLLLLAAGGLAAIAQLPPRVFAQVPWPRTAAALGLACALLVILGAVGERVRFIATGRAWGKETIALTHVERDEIDAAVQAARERGGRAWAGSAGGWGKDYTVKWTPVYAFLSRGHVPQVSFLYHAMALTSDVMVRFDEGREAHWRLFDVRTALAPPDREYGDFATELAAHGRFRVFAGPPSGHFEIVDVAHAVRCDRRSFYDVVDPWLWTDGPAQRRHLALDLRGRFPEPGLPSRPVDERLPEGEPFEGGRVLSEESAPSRHRARVEIDADRAWVLLKETWHPQWRARVDGVAAPTSNLTPGFVAVRVERGSHEVELSYEPGPLKGVLLALAPLVLAAAVVVERRPRGIETSWAPRITALGRAAWARQGVREAAGVAALALLAGAPLLLPGLPSGHDSGAYPARVVEMHENLRHGILLPRWAPDLSAGHGQPFFLYTPPLPGWLAAIPHALGASPERSLGLAVFAALLAGAFFARRAANVVVSRRASWVAAAAFTLAPYVLTDLHVRTAWAESTALLLSPLAAWGLLARRPLLLATGVALVALSHHASSLLLVPLLVGAALGREKGARPLFRALAAVAIGLAVAACAWMPGLLETSVVRLHEAREGYFHWRTHLLEPWQLVWTPWGYGNSVHGPDDGMPFGLGPLHLLLAAVAGACAVDASRRRAAATESSETVDPPGRLRLVAGLLVAVVLVSALMTRLLAPAWEVLPLLPSVQFPWRLSGLAAMLLALLAGLACDLLADRWPRAARWIPAALLVGFVALGFPHARPHSRTHPDPQAWTPSEIARRGTGVTSVEEMEPVTVEARAPWSPGLAASGAAQATAETPERWSLRLPPGAEGLVVLRLHDVPWWSVQGEGVTKLPPEPVTGRVRLDVAASPGERHASLVLRRSPVQRASLAVSGAGVVLLAAWAVASRRRRRAPGPGGPVPFVARDLANSPEIPPVSD